MWLSQTTQLQVTPWEISSYTLNVKTDCGQPLAPTLFAKDVIEGMISMQAHTVGQQLEVPLGVMLLSDTEAVVELSRRVNMDRTLAILAPLQYWLGTKSEVDV